MGIYHRGIAVAAAWFCLASAALAECRADRVDLRGDFGSARFTVELALTPADQARGLMHREVLARSAGMLFIYPEEAILAFWMRNTLIPLDMIFLDEDGVVVKVHSNAIPGDETPIPSDAPARAVLEINGGLADTLGIAPGAQLRSPVMPQETAAWPCEEASQ